jgi:hypothetical protein
VDARVSDEFVTGGGHPLSEVLDELRKEIRNCFVDLSHKEAFDLLYREAWRPEEAAMGTNGS